jgi:hypothetical protein
VDALEAVPGDLNDMLLAQKHHERLEADALDVLNGGAMREESAHHAGGLPGNALGFPKALNAIGGFLPCPHRKEALLREGRRRSFALARHAGEMRRTLFRPLFIGGCTCTKKGICKPAYSVLPSKL